MAELFERGGVELIDGHELFAVEHRPVIENAGHRFRRFERVHVGELCGNVLLYYRFPLVLL